MKFFFQPETNNPFGLAFIVSTALSLSFCTSRLCNANWSICNTQQELEKKKYDNNKESNETFWWNICIYPSLLKSSKYFGWIAVNFAVAPFSSKRHRFCIAIFAECNAPVFETSRFAIARRRFRLCGSSCASVYSLQSATVYTLACACHYSRRFAHAHAHSFR